MTKTIALIPAAGIGKRFGAKQPKQYTQLKGKSVLFHTLQRLSASNCFDALVVVVSPDDQFISIQSLPENTIKATNALDIPTEANHKQTPIQILYCGGETRAHTVVNGVNFLINNQWISKSDKIAVHDAARCGIDSQSLKRLVESNHSDGAILALPVADTLKLATDDGKILRTVDRNNLWRAQTPQIFPAGLLQQALNSVDLYTITDEASALEKLGYSPQLILGNECNLKLTHADDKNIMNNLLNTQNNLRIGQGYDVHRLVADRPLILGGINIPHETGLYGHSDADVLLHAIIDAILGATGQGDIGTHFPDTDDKWHNADSSQMLKYVWDNLYQSDWRIINIDCTIIAQRPKLASFIVAIKNNIANLLNINNEQVNIKAKTNEKLGYLGREEAIEAQAVVLLNQI
ncbi:MAG: 2-C-methyl-D-erythritol 4-phosphate cytidylyltransferase [Neisseriaceae bacterium]|nr:2-C-methyl-D-erythritol 4-phosphate cytidylyltransferase [Neisseriaceae bacterium]